MIWSVVRSPFGHGGEDSEAEMIVEVSEGDGSGMGKSMEGRRRSRKKMREERDREKREIDRRGVIDMVISEVVCCRMYSREMALFYS